MRKAILGAIVALLLVGAYASYVISYPKYPKVEGCVNPFAVVKPVSRVQENWSKINVFFKLATSRDFWKLAKPWNVDYSHVTVVKHTLEYKGKNITMLAIGALLRDKKHVVVYYEFSEPVRGMVTASKMFSINNSSKLKLVAMMINGRYKQVEDCTRECESDDECGEFWSCSSYCCDTNIRCFIGCCGSCGLACFSCLVGEASSCSECVLCVGTWCPTCGVLCCDKEGTVCLDWGNMP
ncbi:hypothetical protein A3L04_04735 [Thermococcus chitonophagus]|nr:hypothetical protein A3L04_04735 [Thermococcus chitonophagus]